MTTMLIANNATVQNGQFMGDQLCYLKVAYLFVQNQPGVDRIIMSVSPGNELSFIWTKFIETYNVEIIEDSFNPGDNEARWVAWDKWRFERSINGKKFDHYRELYLRIHGSLRQASLCGRERGLGRRNIYEYVYYGQEHCPEVCVGSDWYDDTLIYHPSHRPTRDVYISPHCKTQGNVTFTFDFWDKIVRKLLDAGITITVGYNWHFCEDLLGHPLFRKHWGTYKEWMEQVCSHKLIACGNTGTGWLAAACGVPLFTVEPPNSQMPDHRYRQCGLQNIIDIVSQPDVDYCAKRIIEEVNKCVVMTTGCYDILHAGHIRHLEKSRSLGTKLIVAMNSDKSVSELKGPTRPINPQEQRQIVLEALRCVDEVQVFDGPNALELIKTIKPDILTAGFGYTVESIVGKEYAGKVVVTCQGDARKEPSTTKIIKRTGDIIEICRIASEYSVNPFDKLMLLANTFLKVKDIPGSVADLGAYRGGTSYILNRLAPSRDLFVFDTWEGTPIDDELCEHKKGEWETNLEDCISLVGIKDNVYYIRGIFPQSAISGFSYAFVYVDTDTYQSVKDAISFFWPSLELGGIMMFDDYGWPACKGVKKAIDEKFAEHQRIVYPTQYTCVVKK
jgi:rfaE bifunctional protein nucleotidyltransferase chain/domain